MIINTKVGTYPGVVEASIEITIKPVVRLRTRKPPDFSLIDEIPPGVDVRQGHQVVNVLNRVLETARGRLNVGSDTVRRMTYGVSPPSVTLVVSKAVKLSGL